MTLVKIAVTAVALAFGAGVAMAQTATPPAPVAPKAPAAATTAAPAPKKGAALKKAQTPEAQACSAEADAKNLHGKPRRTFRAKCIKEKMAAAKKG